MTTRLTSRTVRGLVSLVGVSALLAACGGSGAAQGDGVSLTYWMWDANQLPGYQACATQFEADHPDIRINIEQYGWDDYWTQLTARMVAENAPDVFVDHTQQFGKFVGFDQLLDVSDMLGASDLDTSIYVDGLIDLWSGPDGGLYGMPKDWDTVGLFYNADMVAEAGYSQEDLWELEWNPIDGGTFEQFLARMTIDRNGVRGDEEGFNKNRVEVYGMGYNESGGAYGQVQWAPFALSNGWEYANKNPWGTEWNFGDQALIDSIAWYTSLIEKGYLPSLAVASSGVGSQEALGAGGYATLIEGAWNARSISELAGIDAKVAPTPIGPAGHRASVMNGLVDSIWAGTPHPEEAWEWVSYLGGEECQMRMAQEARVFPAVREATDEAVKVFESYGVDARAFSVHVEDGTGVLTPISDRWAQIQTIMQPTMDSIFTLRTPPDSLVGANDRVNALF